MLNTAIILSIIDSLLKLLLIALEKAAPEQVQAILERHDARIEFFSNLLRKVSGD
jgi:hypothetical protein